MTHSSRQQWPMPEYLKAWKLFRDNADENEVTAIFCSIVGHGRVSQVWKSVTWAAATEEY